LAAVVLIRFTPRLVQISSHGEPVPADAKSAYGVIWSSAAMPIASAAILQAIRIFV
jgi:hypothetical protein